MSPKCQRQYPGRTGTMSRALNFSLRPRQLGRSVHPASRRVRTGTKHCSSGWWGRNKPRAPSGQRLLERPTDHSPRRPLDRPAGQGGPSPNLVLWASLPPSFLGFGTGDPRASGPQSPTPGRTPANARQRSDPLLLGSPPGNAVNGTVGHCGVVTVSLRVPTSPRMSHGPALWSPGMSPVAPHRGGCLGPSPRADSSPPSPALAWGAHSQAKPALPLPPQACNPPTDLHFLEIKSECRGLTSRPSVTRCRLTSPALSGEARGDTTRAPSDRHAAATRAWLHAPHLERTLPLAQRPLLSVCLPSSRRGAASRATPSDGRPRWGASPGPPHPAVSPLRPGHSPPWLPSFKDEILGVPRQELTAWPQTV